MPFLKILDNHGNKIPASQFLSAYEAAGTGRRLSNWGTSSMGPNSAIFGSLSSIRSRSRNLVMNTPQASGAIDSFVSNMIGQGITPRWQLDDRDLKEQIQELWADWVKESDSDGTSSFYGQQSLMARSMMESGEVLSRLRFRSQRYDLSVPLQLQVIESDHLDEAYNTLAPNGNEIRMGIEFNAAGDRTAYWLFKDHPAEIFLHADNASRLRVPAKQIQHVYRVLRPGQIRGRPWLTTVIVKMHEIDQCIDAELVRRKTTAMFGGFVTVSYTHLRAHET